MNEFFIIFHIVSFFAFNAFCMNFSSSEPPLPRPPENVRFGDCFVVSGITGETIKTLPYSFNHICPEKVRNDEITGGKNLWFIVGSFKGSETLALEQNLPQFHYIPSPQSLIKFVFLKEKMVTLVFTNMEFEIEFHSLQQSRVFYSIIHNDADMELATRKKIGLLHEITSQEIRYYKEIGKNIAALYEYNFRKWYISFRNELGEPLLIFSHEEAQILLISKPWLTDRLQLLLQIYRTYYILTFSSHDEARQFSEALLQFMKPLHMGRVIGFMKRRFERNAIKVDS